MPLSSPPLSFAQFRGEIALFHSRMTALQRGEAGQDLTRLSTDVRVFLVRAWASHEVRTFLEGISLPDSFIRPATGDLPAEDISLFLDTVLKKLRSEAGKETAMVRAEGPAGGQAADNRFRRLVAPPIPDPSRQIHRNGDQLEARGEIHSLQRRLAGHLPEIVAILPRLHSSDLEEFAGTLHSLHMGHPDRDRRLLSLEIMGEAIVCLPEARRFPWVTVIVPYLSDHEKEVRGGAVRALGRVVSFLKEGDRVSVVKELEKKMDDDPLVIRAVRESIAFLPENRRLNRALKIVGQLASPTLAVRDAVTDGMDDLVTNLPPDQRPRLLPVIRVALEGDEAEVFLGARLAFVSLMRGLEPSIRKDLVLRFAEPLRTESMEATARTRDPLGARIADVLMEISPGLTEDEKKALAVRYVEILESGTNSSGMQVLLEHLLIQMSPDSRSEVASRLLGIRAYALLMKMMKTEKMRPERRSLSALALRLIEMAGSVPGRGRQNHALNELYKGVLASLDIPGRLVVLAELVKKYRLAGLPLESLLILSERLPSQVFVEFAEKQEDPDLKKLAAYGASLLPFESYFWDRYLSAGNPDTYLQTTATALRGYRRGARLTSRRPSDGELYLAFAGLDRPDQLPFEVFRRGIRAEEPPPLFLDRSFQEVVAEAEVQHVNVDRGLIQKAMAPLAAVKTGDDFKGYLRELVKTQGNHLRKLKPLFEAAYTDNVETIGTDRLLSGSRQLVPGILNHYGEKQIPRPVQELLFHLILFVGWNRSGVEAARSRIVPLWGKVIASETLLRGFQALEEFYRDMLGDVIRELLSLPQGQALPENKIPPPLRDQRNWLTGALSRLSREETGAVTVEFVPSKSQADIFFGYVGEDCTKVRGEQSIYHPDFQIYRMIAREQLVGEIYVQRHRLASRWAQTSQASHDSIVIAIQPRTFWRVNQASLLAAIERGLGRVAREAGLRYVLLVANDHWQQGNREDMKMEIRKRPYRTISGSTVSGTVFHSSQFLVMWEEGMPIRDG